MTLTYTWAVTGLKRMDAGALEGVIVQTFWTCTGTNEDGVSGTFRGATPFKLEDVDPATFKPFAELTEADVVGWIKGVVVGDYKAHVDEQIEKQITAQAIVSLNADELPWAANP